MEALDLVRQATINDTPVSYQNNHYVFGDLQLHESTSTAFRRTLSNRDGGYYQLKDIILYLENSDLTEAEYRQKCIAAKVTAVVIQDKAALKQYLTGVIDTCDQIDRSRHEPSLAASSASAVETATPSKRKAVAMDETVIADLKILKALRRDEKQYATAESVLCKPGAVLHFRSYRSA